MSLVSVVPALELPKILSSLLPTVTSGGILLQVVSFSRSVVEDVLDYLLMPNDVTSSSSRDKFETIDSSCTQRRRLAGPREKCLSTRRSPTMYGTTVAQTKERKNYNLKVKYF